MVNPIFKTAFRDFINGKEHDQAKSTLIALALSAFQAGWVAAGGSVPTVEEFIRNIWPERAELKGEDLMVERHPITFNIAVELEQEIAVLKQTYCPEASYDQLYSFLLRLGLNIAWNENPE